MKQTPYQLLEKRFERVQVLKSITHLLRWDAEVLMPPGSADHRAQQLTLLDTECTAILRSKKTSRLMQHAEASVAGLSGWQQANVREMRRHWQVANIMPKRLTNSLHRACTKAEVVWRRAHQEKNFRLLAPHLEKVVELVREKAHLLSSILSCTPYDALLDEYDPGNTTAELDFVLQRLAAELPGIIQHAIEKQSAFPPIEIHTPISKRKQKDLGRFLMKRMGFQFNKGRLDESLHPFTEGTAEDLRITSIFSEHDFMFGLMGILHETGHAMYDFGLPAEWFFQPVGRDRGMVVHECQALLVEMAVGRSRAFMRFAAPCMQKIFGVTGKAWEADNLYRLATRVHPGFIRMDADEVTYPLHILIRYELEKKIVAGNLRVRDLPAAWNERFKQLFGEFPPDAAQGCLQDSHWPQGYFGYFPTYALGVIMAAQLFASIRQAQPGVMDEIAEGNFAALFNWLEANIYRHGARYSRTELLRQATGETLNPARYLDYLREKYLEEN